MSSSAVQESTPLKLTRQLIWLYFWLLIVEGALRKWVLPSLSTPLLIVRDPVVIAIYIVAVQARVFPKNVFIRATLTLGILSSAVSFLVIPEHPVVTLYGFRASFLHLPLVFVIREVFTPKDFRRFGLVILLMAVPMAFLVFLQFRADGDAWINKGAGIGAVQIGGLEDGRVRAAGTFSFNNGLGAYITLLGSYLIYNFFRKKVYPIWIVFPGIGAMFLMVACSGSRNTVSEVAILVVAAAAMSIYKPKFIAGSAKALTTILIVYITLGSWAVVKEGTEVLDNRFTTAGGVKEGLIDRFVTALIPVAAVTQTPIFGNGLGMGTNAAANLLTGHNGFLLAETEWDRNIQESGPLLGLAYIFLRIAIVVYIGRSAFESLNREDALAALLFAAGAISFANGQFAQPSELGFAVFTMGLCLGACNLEEERLVDIRVSAPSVSELPPTVRSRSVYSDELSQKSQKRS